MREPRIFVRYDYVTDDGVVRHGVKDGRGRIFGTGLDAAGAEDLAKRLHREEARLRDEYEDELDKQQQYDDYHR